MRLPSSALSLYRRIQNVTRGKLLVWQPEPTDGLDIDIADIGVGIESESDSDGVLDRGLSDSGSLIAKTRMVLGVPSSLSHTRKNASPFPAADPQRSPDRKMDDAGMFYGSHPRMLELRAALPRIAACDVPVLIQGETGTGKEVVARQIHRLSHRSNRPFVKLNCAAVPAELAESELFGYERGAFTGAHQRKPGIFEMANGGTVMLDEIGDMEFRLQAKLLQVLQDQEFRRVGGTDSVKVNVRVISATHRDLRQAGRDNTFRPDLFYRLNGFSLTVPSLRERRDDVMVLAEFLFAKYAEFGDMPHSPALEHAFLNYDWPGNIRELEMAVRKLAVLGDPELIVNELREHAQFSAFTASVPGNLSPVFVERRVARQSAPARPQPAAAVSIIEHASRAQQEAEMVAIRSALQSTRWNRKQAAVLLNLDYKALLYKMKKLGIR
jgi:two-component system response regulator AtoC